MKLGIRHIGHSPVRASNIIKITIIGTNTTIQEDVTDLNGHVDENLIMALRNIADELEAQNGLLVETK